MRGLLLRARVVVRTSNMSFGRLRHKIVPKSVPHVQHDFVFLIQPVKSLICSIDVSVPVVVSSLLLIREF